MKFAKITATTFAALALSMPTAAPAAKPLPTVQTYDLADVLNDPSLAKELPAGVRFYFGDKPAKVVRTIGPVKGSKRTGLGKDPSVSCRKAMVNLMAALARDVQDQGGNALVAVRSNLFNAPTSSDTQFRCALGEKKVSVALTGQIAVVE
ncbi:hypothetical protein GVN21_04850 [Caulobacter sp. SLTY]|uniref:hypothetical protein n=1 Tax=Caulobacter sp. SLTY TaxID=2683262 RepID=UPI001412F9D3|nr:hypothetical protein [Caulobacter sp. SLTY]NBB14690.1 hypothetical protein [Caulobacter sp. SLTY]